jgi:uncharacterized protein YggE
MQNSYLNNNLDQNQNIMTLTGKGQVTAIPDLAILRFGVESIGENLTEIQNENARISQTILQSLQQMNINDIKTAQYNIQKVYEYIDNQQIDKGYLVRNIFEVRLKNMDQVGLVIDLAVANGANVVDLVEFDISDPNDYYLQALNLAIKNAQEKAMSITETLDIIVDSVPKRVTETSTLPITTRSIALREGAFATPVETGSKLIEASVTMEFVYYKL